MKTKITVLTGNFSVEYEEEENVRHKYRIDEQGLLIITSYTFDEEYQVGTRTVIYNANEWCRVIVNETK